MTVAFSPRKSLCDSETQSPNPSLGHNSPMRHGVMEQHFALGSSGPPEKGLALVADPLYKYIPFTIPKTRGETTERELMDTPWVQRLRGVGQLQSAKWVYPSAEHSRFQHVLGAMHMASAFARRLYPGLKQHVRGAPSFPLVEETLRVAGLLHDVGHGPFSHFFDEHYLEAFGLNHELVGQRIITGPMAEKILALRRAPSGPFHDDERVNPQHVAWLINKRKKKALARAPRWLTVLAPVFQGIYTPDNLDYVMRDAYMTGVSADPLDTTRLLHHTFVSAKGLTLNRPGVSALMRFINMKLYLYANVYFHRTVRAIDLMLADVFEETVKILHPHNPVDPIENYLCLTDAFLLENVRDWHHSNDPAKHRLGLVWADILGRHVRYKMAHEETFSLREPDNKVLALYRNPKGFEENLRRHLPAPLQNLPLRVDFAIQDPRPMNPIEEGEKRILVYTPGTGKTDSEPIHRYYEYVPAKVIHCRVFTSTHGHDKAVSQAIEKMLTAQGLA